MDEEKKGSAGKIIEAIVGGIVVVAMVIAFVL